MGKIVMVSPLNAENVIMEAGNMQHHVEESKSPLPATSSRNQYKRAQIELSQAIREMEE